MLEEVLKQIVDEKKRLGISSLVIRNFLKEYIQYLILSLIYNNKKTKELIFKGGSCLRVIYDLPRLSEDLDFDYDEKKVGKDFIDNFSNYLEKEIKEKYFKDLKIKIQKDWRIYFKFPVLRKIGLSSDEETDNLLVKIELSSKIEPFSKFILTPISKYGFNFVAKSYDLPSLMAGKINAFLYRIWYKGKENEVDIKGRDFYDLYWFLKNKIQPNWKMLKKITGIKNLKDLKKALKERIKKKVTPEKLAYDLNNFIQDQSFVWDFAKNYKMIMEKLVESVEIGLP
jgi:predicted nucleotidyltransferase component of viral defense system